MIQHAVSFIESRVATIVRSAFMLILCGMLGGQAVHSMAQVEGSTLPLINAIDIEHRFTRLETNVSNMNKTIDGMADKEWIKVLTLMGLAGEAGFRNLKGKKKEEE